MIVVIYSPIRIFRGNATSLHQLHLANSCRPRTNAVDTHTSVRIGSIGYCGTCVRTAIITYLQCERPSTSMRVLTILFIRGKKKLSLDVVLLKQEGTEAHAINIDRTTNYELPVAVWSLYLLDS